MSNNTVISYDTYTEITNGLFADPKEEILLKNNLESTNLTILDLRAIEDTLLNIEPRSNYQTVVYTSEEGYRQFNIAMQEEIYAQLNGYETRGIIRDEAEGLTMEQFEAAYPRTNNTTTERALNEEIWHQVRNMSEEETIQYFDRISQEE